MRRRGQGQGFIVQGTIYAFQGFETERIYEFQEELQQAIGVPIQVQLTVVPATLTVAGEEIVEPLDEDSTVLRSEEE